MREKGYAGTTVLAVGKVIMGKVPERAPGKSTHSMFYAYILPPTRNGNPFDPYEAISGPIKLVIGSNCSLGSYRFDKISTIASGQVLQIEKLIS